MNIVLKGKYVKKSFICMLILFFNGGTLFALDGVLPSLYVGIGVSGGYVSDDMVDIVNDDKSIVGLVNFVIPIQLGISFVGISFVNSYSDDNVFNYVSIRGDFSFDFGTPFKVGGTAGGSIDFNLGYVLIGVGGGYRWIDDSLVDENIRLKETGFPYVRMSFGVFNFVSLFLKPTLFVDFILPDRGGNIGINVGFTVMINALSPFYESIL